MTHTSVDSSKFQSQKDWIINAGLAGLGAGLFAAILDTRQAARVLDSAQDVAFLFVQAAGRLSFGGAVLGFVVAALAMAGGVLARRWGYSERKGAVALQTLIALFPLIYIAYRLFRGGYTSKLPATGLLTGVTALVLVCMFWTAAGIMLSLVERARRGELRRTHIVFICTALVLVSLGLRFMDAYLYRRLYLYLHTALGFVTVGGLALAIRIAMPEAAPRRRLALVSFGLSLVLFVIALTSFEARQTVKTAAWDHTATLADALRITSFSRGVEAHGRPSGKVRALRKERARRIQAVATDEYPVFPSAHVLLVTIDALRADRLGVYGHSGRDLSPNLDRWARDKGIVFEHAYCAAPHSSFSLTSLHTSRYTHDEAMLGREIKHTTLAEILRDYGYDTWAFYTQGIFFTDGDQVGHYRRSGFGFNHVKHGAFPPDELTDKAIEAIDTIAAEGSGPSFMWVHYFNVHEPYKSTRFGNSPVDRYEGEIFETDAEVVRLLTHATKTLPGGVVIALSADHGEEFKDHGGYYHGSSLYEEQVRVPFIFQLPDMKPGHVRAPVSITGFAPTVLRLVGVSPPGAMRGQDLRPALFKGDDKHVAEPVFASVMRHHMVVSWPYKLIADPSRRLFELYNLKKDPGERINVYDKHRTIADELLGEMYAWIDEMGKGKDEAHTAINLGHMRDPRAIPGLLRVATNTGAPISERVEAVRLLGEMRDHSVIPKLRPLVEETDEQVAIAAAMTLGSLGDLSGQDLMRDVLFDEDPDIRDRAALVLGRRGDKAAGPALIEALGRDDVKMREQAIRMLGRLGDPETADALIEALAEDRTRYLVVLALGKVGNHKALGALTDVLEHDQYTDVRGYAVVGLGWLGMAEAVPRLVQVLREEPEIKWTAEALVRLGGVGKAPVFGTDVARGLPALTRGFGRCTEKPEIVHGEFLGRTLCRTLGRTAELGFDADAPKGATVILRARHLLADKGRVAQLAVLVDGNEVFQVKLGGELEEFRVDTPAEAWPDGKHRVVLALGQVGAFELDHFLVLAK
ncbi:MAG: sulfatase-like hydrolase/transferase [Deltaproteobacteria bacterium]|nr:sulfatase-like hydrolase/transferase [Deltaproteobacteria bacterium]